MATKSKKPDNKVQASGGDQGGRSKGSSKKLSFFGGFVFVYLCPRFFLPCGVLLSTRSLDDFRSVVEVKSLILLRPMLEWMLLGFGVI